MGLDGVERQPPNQRALGESAVIGMQAARGCQVQDVTAFGAAGDGLHDDTQAVRDAVAAVKDATAVNASGRQVAGSGIVYFPSVVRRGGVAPGSFEAVAVYRITDTIEIPGRKNVRLVSEAPFGARLSFSGTGTPYLFGSGAGKRAHVYENLVLQGGGVLLEGGGRGITEFASCSFVETADFAIKTLGRSVVGCSIVACEFAETSGGVGILHSACDLWMIGPSNRFVRIDGVGVQCHSSGVTIIDCNFENKAVGAGAHPHVRIEPGDPFAGGQSKLIRCRFGGEVGSEADGPPEIYVVLGPSAPVSGTMSGIVIQGCEFQRRNGGPSDQSGHHAIRLTKAVRESRILENQFQQFSGPLIDEAFCATGNIRDNYFALNSVDSNNHVAGIFSSGDDPPGWTVLHGSGESSAAVAVDPLRATQQTSEAARAEAAEGCQS